MNSNTIAVETCQEGGEYKMCPLCEDCDYWDLKDICLYKRLAYLFDHPGTVFYAIFMSFWGKNATMIVIAQKKYCILLLVEPNFIYTSMHWRKYCIFQLCYSCIEGIS